MTSIFPFTVESSTGAATSATLTAPFTVETLTERPGGAVMRYFTSVRQPSLVVVVAVDVPAPPAAAHGHARLLRVERELAVLVLEAHLDVFEPLVRERLGRGVHGHVDVGLERRAGDDLDAAVDVLDGEGLQVSRKR